MGIHQGGLAAAVSGAKLPVVKLVKTYNSRLEADFAKIALSAKGIPATVIGIDLAMEGGIDGVKVLVRDEQADAARDVLAERRQTTDKTRT